MKQFTLKSLMLLLLLLIGGGSYAWGETKTITLDKIGTEVGTTSNTSVKTTSISLNNGSDKFVLNYLQGKKQGYAILLAKSKGAFISNNTPVPGIIKSVEVCINTGASGKTTYHCAFSKVECTEAYTKGSTAENIQGGKSHVFNCGVENANYFCISLGNAYNGQVLKLVITYEDSSTPQPGEVAIPTLSLEEGTYWKTQTLTIGVPEGAAGVKYTLDGTDPKESNTAKSITEATALELSATTTVKAVAVDNNKKYSKEVSRTYTFVPSIANTKETAYTTVEAIAIINKTSDAQLKDEVVYVKGIVSKIDSYKNSSITYWLDDNTFQVYSGMGLDNKGFNSKEDIETGANVIICGKIKKFNNNTYEFDKGNYLVEYKAPVEKLLKSIAISGEATKTTYTEGEAFDPTGLVVTATYEDESTEVVTGRVKWTFNPETLAVGITEVNVTATYGEKTVSKTVGVTVTEAPKTVDIDLTKDQTTTATTDKLEWLGEFVTVTANKAADGTNANNYYPGTKGKKYTSTRFYKNSTLTFTPAPFVVLGEITYEATSDSYVNAMTESTWTNATAEANGMSVTITPIDGTRPVSATIGATTGGKSFSIRYTLANEISLGLVAKSNDTYYATFSSACACEFVGAEVFTVNVEGENIVLNEVASKQVPANMGVLVKSTANVVAVNRLESAPAIEGTNLLKPASEQMTEGFKFYKLAYDNYTEKTGLGFYWGAAEGGAFTVKPGLAYLAVPQAQAANVKGFSFDGTQTGINGVEATTAKGAIYNLNGQRVEKAQRGIYIQNGKKFIVK